MGTKKNDDTIAIPAELLKEVEAALCDYTDRLDCAGEYDEGGDYEEEDPVGDLIDRLRAAMKAGG